MADIQYLKVYVDELFKVALEGMHQVAENIKTRMMEEGKPIQYPVQWDSERQRLAFFATNGFGKGIPYQRNHQYRLGWKTERTPFNRQYRVLLSNKHPAGAVGGMVRNSQWQSRIHRSRWNYLPKILYEELAKLPQEVSNHIKAIAL